ncbi:MAG TPA: endonuclease/exonuclease/phosphatase family protein [Allosphingosinicella sp.]|jgi:hypothetical protein
MSYLQVASWNIEHLGGTNRATRKQSAFALAEHIEMSGIDVIALQEIYVTAEEEVHLTPGGHIVPSQAATERRNSDLDLVCYLLEEHLDDTEWKYYIAPNRDEGDTSQLCAVLWNSKRLALDAVRRLDVSHDEDGDSLWDRTPHLFEFVSEIRVWRRNDQGEWEQRAETRRLAMVPLHMKANVGGETLGRRRREKEARTLCQALANLGEALEESLVLIGDTNVLSSAEPAIDLFYDAGFIDLNNHDIPTYGNYLSKGAPFDRAFVRKNRNEFKYSRQYVLHSTDIGAHDKFLSDHYMIKIPIKDYVDDNDSRHDDR